MKKLLLLLLITVSAIAQQQPTQPAQGLFNGTVYANGYADWSVPMGLNASFSWTATSFCTANSGGTSFPAFTVGTPIEILDQNNPALNEVVTVTAVNVFATGCSISTTTPVNQHSAFSLTTATGGLQEAINANLSTPVNTTVHLTADWYKAGGQIGQVTTSIVGNAKIGIVDDTQVPAASYIWNGSHYVLTSVNGASLATYSVPGLEGGGRCFVYPSSISTDAFAAFNACTAQLPAAGGTIDATALGTANYTVATPLTALNTTQFVTLLLNKGTSFTIDTSFATPTDSPASCAVPVGGYSSIIVPGENASNANFLVGPSARVWDVVCSGHFDGTQESFRLDGVNILGNSSATVMGSLLHLQGVFVGTRVSNSSTDDCYANCVEVNPGTSTTIVSDLIFDGDDFQDSATGATYPGAVVTLDTLNSSGGMANIIFVGGAIQYNGAHNPLLVINGRGSTQAYGITFYNVDFETSAATTSSYWTNVDPIQITDASGVTFSNLKAFGANNPTYQQNLVDIFGTRANAQYGININQAVVGTGDYACIIKNSVEGTCETGFPTGFGDNALPNYTFGQVFPQIRQSNVAPPATVGICPIGSMWTVSTGTTSGTTFYGCYGPLGGQYYQSIGGGGGGGQLGTLQNDLPVNNAANTAAIDTYNFQATGTYLPQTALTAAGTYSGVVTLLPSAGNTPFTNPNFTKVNDLDHHGASYRSLTEFGAQCDTRTVFGSLTATSTTLAVSSNALTAADVGKTITAVGIVSGTPTRFDTTVFSITDSLHAVLTTASPITVTGQPMPLGHDDSAAIVQGEAAALSDIAQSNGSTNTAIVIPTGNCLTHTIPYNGASIVGLGPSSILTGFPGEDLFLAPDPSSSTPAEGNSVVINSFTAYIDNRIDATLPWQIINNSGTTAKAALNRPAGIKSAFANNPLGPGWFQGAGPNNSGAIAGVGAINSGTPTSMTVPAGLTLPVATNTIVFPYLTTVFTTTVSSVNTGTRVVTLGGSYPGVTASQIVWFAGTSVQSLATSIGSGACPATITLNNPITPNPSTETNVAPFGLIQVDAEQMAYYGKTNAGNLGSQFLTITGCAQGGTARAAHSTNATVVPLNPFNPSTPWPVTPTVNSNATTPVNAAFYPAWNVGNAFFAAPDANGNAGTAAGSFANSHIAHLWINSSSSVPVNHTAEFYLVSLPYHTGFEGIIQAGLYFGPMEATPALNTGGSWAAAQPTADGTHWENMRITSCVVSDLISGGQNSFKDWEASSNCYNGSSYTGAQACFLFTQGWSDQTGNSQAIQSSVDLHNMYCEPGNGSLYGQTPVFEEDILKANWDNLHMGGGGEFYLGGTNQHFQGGNFNNQAVFPLINYGAGNSSDFTQLAFFGTGVGNTYGTNSLINYGPNAAFSGAMSAENPYSAPYGANQLGNSREPWHGQDELPWVMGINGTAAAPVTNENGGYIPAWELNSSLSYEANPFTTPWYYDPASPSGGSAGCTMNTGGTAACFSYQFDQAGIAIGPGQRIVGGKYMLSVASHSTGAASSYQIKVGVCSLGDTATLTVPVTSAYSTPYTVEVDFTTPLASCPTTGKLSLDFIYPSSNDTITVGYVNFAPLPYQFNAYQINLLNAFLLNGSPGTSGQVLVSQGPNTLPIWGNAGISGGTLYAVPVFSGPTAVIPGCFGDTGTIGSYNCPGGFQVISSTPGAMGLVAGSGPVYNGAGLKPNSGGFVAPASSASPCYYKLPSTVGTGFLFAAPCAIASPDNVNESLMSSQHIEFPIGGAGNWPFFTGPEVIRQAVAVNAGHFVNLLVTNTAGGSCTTAPTFNIFVGTTLGTSLVGSTTQQAAGTVSPQAQTLPFTTGQVYGVEMVSNGSGCTGGVFDAEGVVEEP